MLTQVGFTDTLPSGLALASPPNAVDTCGGTHSNVIARIGGSTMLPGFFNAQFASALNDASATLVVGEALPANVPTLSGAALAMLAAFLAVVALAASRRR